LCFQLPEDTSIHHFVTELIEETKRFEETKKVGDGKEEGIYEQCMLRIQMFV